MYGVRVWSVWVYACGMRVYIEEALSSLLSVV